MRRAVLLLGLAVFGAASARAEDASMLFASVNQARMIVGRYLAKAGLWQDLEKFYAPPEPDALFSLFDARGKVQEVRLKGKRRADPRWVPIGWSEKFVPRLPDDRSFALALDGSRPAPVRTATPIALDEASLREAVARYLKTRGLAVASPLLTEAWAIDLDGDGQPERLVCAHNDMSAVREGQRDLIYAVALLLPSPHLPGAPSAPVVLGAQTSIKPSEQSMDDCRRLNGTRDYFRFLAFADVDGDGRLEIAVYRAIDDAMQIDLWTFRNARARPALSAYKQNFN